MESHDEERLMFKNLEYGAVTNDYSVKDLATALKRQELAANFFFTIPGPKMIWQFGERGYDVSIEYGGLLGEKPPKWDYMDEWNRKNLFYVYSALIDLKKNEEVFSSTDFTLDLNNELKKIKLSSDDMSVVVLGNFDLVEDNINPQFQTTGTWYDYWTGDSLQVTDVNITILLQAGEYRLYTSKKLNKPAYVGIDDTELVQNNIIIFPNPATETINVLSAENIVSLNIYNLMGSLVYSTEVYNNEILSIDVRSFNKGYYITKTQSNNGKTYTNKFIIR